MYLTPRLYRLLILTGLICLAGYIWLPLLWFGQWLLVGIVLTLGLDISLLWGKNDAVRGSRQAPARFSHADEHQIALSCQHQYTFSLFVELIDELPEQFARADAVFRHRLKPGEEARFDYMLRPLFRGEYNFGRLRAWISSPIGLVQRGIILAGKQVVPTYPAFRRLRQYALMGTSNRQEATGSRHRLGTQRQEFEHIKAYVLGDDVRTLNWKATARQRRLMVNQYRDARAQSVYCFIDQSQMMEQTWEEISLLDHAINATVMIAHVALSRQDRVGVATFDAKIGLWLPLQHRKAQVQRILDHLYKVEPSEGVADFERLYATIRKKVPQRSTLILFTHFPTRDFMQRQLPALQRIAMHHQLLVVCFEPMEIHEILAREPEGAQGLRIQTLARQRLRDHHALMHEMRRRGMHVLSSRPDELRLTTLNRYLGLRRGQ
ncbi:MAG: DUF58 domain-containing protein [Bacteroidota bacterium]